MINLTIHPDITAKPSSSPQWTIILLWIKLFRSCKPSSEIQIIKKESLSTNILVDQSALLWRLQ